MHPRSLAERQGPCIPRSLLALAHLFMAAQRASDPSPSALSESPSIARRTRLFRSPFEAKWPGLRTPRTFSARATTCARSLLWRVRDASSSAKVKRALTRAQRRPCKSESCCPLTVISSLFLCTNHAPNRGKGASHVISRF